MVDGFDTEPVVCEGEVDRISADVGSTVDGILAPSPWASSVVTSPSRSDK